MAGKFGVDHLVDLLTYLLYKALTMIRQVIR